MTPGGLLAQEVSERRHAFVAVPGRGTLVVRPMRGDDQRLLERLRGLAVPRIVRLSAAERRELVGDYDQPLLVTRYAGRWLGYYPFSPAQLVGAFVFVTEQLVAFHREGLLYTDIKFTNVVCAPGLKDLRIIDVEGCVPVRPDDRYPLRQIAYTPRFSAPEHLRQILDETPDAVVPENVVVYQLGMLPIGAHGGLLRLEAATGNRQRWRLLREVFEPRYPEMVALWRRCTHADPARRPQSIAAVLEEARALLDDPSYRYARRVYERLRRPYQAALEPLGRRAR